VSLEGDKMEVLKRDVDEKNYLILKENETITILVENNMKASIHILCKNKKLFLRFEEDIKKDTTLKYPKSK